MSRRNDSEEAAALAVLRVVGGAWEINDTGEANAQYDVTITTEQNKTIALEATSFDSWKQTRARVSRAHEKRLFDEEGLSAQWLVVIATGIGIRELHPALEETLRVLETENRSELTVRYDGDDTRLKDAAAKLLQLGVRSVTVFDPDPAPDEPRVLLAQSDSSIGGSGALPTALARVLAKGDNQAKLATADCDERHLYVFVEDGNAGAVLAGQWPLPECPPDPHGVLDAIWVYSPSVSGRLFRVRPGTSDWSRFEMTTGNAVG
jgi:hypothetical protein